MKTAFLVELLWVVLVVVGVWGNKKNYRCRKTDAMGGYFLGECPCSDGVWAAWGYWRLKTKCGRTCYAKTRICIRNCGSRCPGADIDYDQGCDPLKCAVNGAWSEYLPWSPIPRCAVSCGGGMVTIRRHRFCVNPPPAYSAKRCVGKSTEVLYVGCNKDNCPGA